jgi:hypothetical protein
VILAENLPSSIVAALVDAGFDVVRVGDVRSRATTEWRNRAISSARDGRGSFSVTGLDVQDGSR